LKGESRKHQKGLVCGETGNIKGKKWHRVMSVRKRRKSGGAKSNTEKGGSSTFSRESTSKLLREKGLKNGGGEKT